MGFSKYFRRKSYNGYKGKWNRRKIVRRPLRRMARRVPSLPYIAKYLQSSRSFQPDARMEPFTYQFKAPPSSYGARAMLMTHHAYQGALGIVRAGIAAYRIRNALRGRNLVPGY